jgi:small nuclear ribonucleoprotein B and B'
LAAGPGIARPAGRGLPIGLTVRVHVTPSAAISNSCQGPAAGIGGAPPGLPGFPGGAPPPGFPGRGTPFPHVPSARQNTNTR